MRKVLIELNGLEFTVRVLEQQSTDNPAVEQKGMFTVESSDGTALLAITRLWLAGASVEAIAKALELGLLPKK